MATIETLQGSDILTLPSIENLEASKTGPLHFHDQTHPRFDLLNSRLRICSSLVVLDLYESAEMFAAEGEFGYALEVLDKALGWRKDSVEGKHYHELAESAVRAGEIDFGLAIVMDNERILAGRNSDNSPEPITKRWIHGYETSKLALDWLGEAASICRLVAVHTTGDLTPTEEIFRDKVEASLRALEFYCVDKKLPVNPYHPHSETDQLSVGLAKVCDDFDEAGEDKWVARILKIDPAVIKYSERISEEAAHTTKQRLGNIALAVIDTGIAAAVARDIYPTLRHGANGKRGHIAAASLEAMVVCLMAKNAAQRGQAAIRGIGRQPSDIKTINRIKSLKKAK